MKYIFITGGVCSSLGKGIASASIGTLLESCNLKVSFRKFDGYLNVNSGTMNPEQHGEVYVCDDGTECDLDMGHYYRFTNYNPDQNTSITAGKVYKSVIKKEEKGAYDGDCVQVMPHIVDEVKERIYNGHDIDTDVVLIEIGGTVGDIENEIAIEAARQIRAEQEVEDCCFIHMVYLPQIRAAKEWKTKPAQQSCSILMGMGIIPDIILCRIETAKVPAAIRDSILSKISKFCNVSSEDVIFMDNVRSVYQIPEGHWNHLPYRILDHLDIDEDYFLNNIEESSDEDSSSGDIIRNENWLDKVNKFNFVSNPNKLHIGIFGKYVNVEDSYKSIKESLNISGYHFDTDINSVYYSSLDEVDEELDGILIPGGFGYRGTESKQQAFLYGMENNIPCLGLCLGFQMGLIAYAREYCGIKNAWHEEFRNEFNLEGNPDFIFHLMEDQKKIKKRSGTMRLGEYRADFLTENSQFYKAYRDYGIENNSIIYEGSLSKNNKKLKNEEYILERHRHRFEFNNKFKKKMEENGVVFVASHGKLMEACEIIKKNKWFIGVQYHPELKSKFLSPHPLFMIFIKKCLALSK